MAAEGKQSAGVRLRVVPQREQLQAGEVCIDSCHMLNTAYQHGCSWYDFSKDIQLRWRMVVISICTTLIQFSALFPRNRLD